MNNIDILVIGVGGQGSVLASDIICEVALLENLDVKKSEIHGMAQRGGSVVSHVRIGKKIYSPTISYGCANFIISLERMEFLRYLEYVSDNTVLLLNSQRIIPTSIINDAALYPDDKVEQYKRYFNKVYEIDAFKIATEAGNPKGVSVLMLGLFASMLPFSMENWEKAITGKVPKKTIEGNLTAFRRGYETIKR